jgi:5-methylcytosine-specific restriction protein B
MTISESRKQLIQTFSLEFTNNYLMEPKGQRHLSLYQKEKQEVRKYWEDIKVEKSKGQEYYKDVLEKLLPYQDTRHNREKGYRISVMPAITKDLKVWFENANWQVPGNWPKVGHAIFDLIYQVVENENYDAFKEFEDNHEISKGIKSGFISPTLFFLNPKYRVINNKTIRTVNFILEKNKIGRDLTGYLEYVGVIDKLIGDLNIDLFNEVEKFDMFCHFMCDKRLGGYAKYIDKSINAPEQEDDEDEDIQILDDELEPTGHWEAIYYITLIGKKLGYKTYVADPSRVVFNKKLGEVADLTEVPQIMKSAPEIHRVDAIWYTHKPPFLSIGIEN